MIDEKKTQLINCYVESNSIFVSDEASPDSLLHWLWWLCNAVQTDKKVLVTFGINWQEDKLLEILL